MPNQENKAANASIGREFFGGLKGPSPVSKPQRNQDKYFGKLAKIVHKGLKKKHG